MLGVPAPSFPSSLSQQRQGSSSGRSKIALRPGRSLMDWIKLSKGEQDLQGFKGRTKAVSLDELSHHKTVDDCWMAIRGQVYNVSHYMEYHPGGVEELMKGAGQDATDLFEGVHKWVNFSSMLAKCYIGPLKYEMKLTSASKSSSKKENTFLVPKPPVVLKDSLPRYEWYEKGTQLILSIYVKQHFHSSDVILDCEDGKVLDVKILFSEKYYRIHLEMEHSLRKVSINTITSKKIEIILQKEDDSVKWGIFGKELPGHNVFNLNKNRELKFRSCRVSSVQQVTYNTKLYTIELPLNCYYECPIGHHIKVKSDVDGIEIVRSYTVALPSLDSTETTKNGKLLHLMIKHYENGALTPTLNVLDKGSVICVSDCTGSFNRSMLENKSKIYLIAAGTGLTPMIRLITHYMHSTEKNCEMKFLFANKEEQDILWKHEIDDIANKFPSRFHCSYILSEPNASWDGLRGRICKETLRTFISETPFLNEKGSCVVLNKTPAVSTGELFTICGPDEFTLSIKKMLSDIGITDSSIHCFLG